LTKNYSSVLLFKASNYAEANDALKTINIDVVILDININGKVDFEIFKIMKTIQPEILILVFSEFEEESFSYKSLIKGANGYLSKFSTGDEIEVAIDQISKKRYYLKKTLQNRNL
jgi:two-component system, NarL family, invasion response regulator UvrY